MLEATTVLTIMLLCLVGMRYFFEPVEQGRETAPLVFDRVCAECHGKVEWEEPCPDCENGECEYECDSYDPRDISPPSYKGACVTCDGTGKVNVLCLECQ
jgi:hypothetical protein